MAPTNVPVIFYVTDEFKTCDTNHDPFYIQLTIEISFLYHQFCTFIT